MSDELTFQPATADRLDDVMELFGPNGAYSNCWCTWWILSGRDFDAPKAEDRKRILCDLIDGGAEPGLLAYAGDSPVGWVAVGPRERYARMMSARATVNGPLDFSDPGWVINCFYIPRPERGRGVATGLLSAAVDFAFARGATSIGGHPIDVAKKSPDAALYVGTLQMFLDVGFTVAQWRGARPVVRLDR